MSEYQSGGGGGDPLGGVGEDDDDELMQVENVDDIVNQAVEVSQTGGSQAPSPLWKVIHFLFFPVDSLPVDSLTPPLHIWFDSYDVNFFSSSS